MSDSDTPRTDKEVFLVQARPDVDLEGVDADFARQLERENAALRKDKERLDWLERNWVNWPLGNVVDTIRAGIDAAMKEAQP
jgi:hypothetical protein